MEAYLLSTQPSSSSTRDPSLKPSTRRPKRPSLQQAVHALLPADGRAVDSLESITRINRALVGTLGQADNPVTGSTAYSRTLQVQSCASGHQSGGGGSGAKWTLHRNAKLKLQQKDAESQVLKGVVAYISGYTGKYITNTQLKELVERLGGICRNITSGASTTHIFAANLSGSKAQKYVEAKKKNRAKIVTPEWAVECAKKGKRVCESRFVVRMGDEIQESTYDYFPPVAPALSSRSPSLASTRSSSSSSSTSISPPLASTSTATRTSRATPPVSPPPPDPLPRLRPTPPSKQPTSATALLLAQLDAAKAASPPSSPKKESKSKRRKSEAVRGSPRKRKKETEVVVLVSSDAEASLGDGEGGEEEENGLDEWGMPPSGQRR